MAQEALSGVRVVRAYRQEHAEIERFRRSNRYLRRNRKLIVIQGFFFPRCRSSSGSASMLVLWLGSRAVIAHGFRSASSSRSSLPDDAVVADDRVRVGHQHAAAGHGVGSGCWRCSTRRR